MITPVSAPNSSNRFNGSNAIDVNKPLKASALNLVLENDASKSMDVWTPILLAVVPDINSLL